MILTWDDGFFQQACPKGKIIFINDLDATTLRTALQNRKPQKAQLCSECCYSLDKFCFVASGSERPHLDKAEVRPEAARLRLAVGRHDDGPAPPGGEADGPVVELVAAPHADDVALGHAEAAQAGGEAHDGLGYLPVEQRPPRVDVLHPHPVLKRRAAFGDAPEFCRIFCGKLFYGLAGAAEFGF